MACPAILSGPQFLGSALTAIDCHARTIGAYGFGALAQPGSPASLAVTGLLTLFVALFGVRLLLGYGVATRDLVGDVLKAGIVLTLVTSWPAWRVLGYDLVIEGPGEVARAIGLAAGLPGVRGDLIARLARVDEALAALNLWGAGRLRGISQGDWFQLGLARSAFLLGTLAPLALVRLATGLLLAIAPLVAGLLLFGVTRGLFAGWVRGLALCLLASLGLTIVLGVELAMIEPWLQDTLQRRIGGEEMVGLPPEAVALTAGFLIVTLGMIWITARIAFHPAVARVRGVAPVAHEPHAPREAVAGAPGARLREESVSHARSMATSISEALSREERFSRSAALSGSPALAAAGAPAAASGAIDGGDRLGTSWRRPVARATGAAAKRDQA